MDSTVGYVDFFGLLRHRVGERELRLVSGALAKTLPRGGVSLVASASGLSRPTVYGGMRELEGEVPGPSELDRQRKAGGGRKALEARDATLEGDLMALVSSHQRGDPESPLTWTSKSLRTLAAELEKAGHSVGHVTVGRLLQKLGFTLQSNKKSHEGGDRTGRDGQFAHIAMAAQAFVEMEQPVISVDAKKKELVGNFKNNGRAYHPKGEGEKVEVYDFVNENGRATPYGIYDIAANEGFVNVGVSHDTAEFAVDSIRRWWAEMGHPRYPHAHSLLITADGGGSNGSRNRLWKTALQRFADDAGLNVCVCHLPPGTSKWNKIEHRMFSVISMNWRGRPLTSVEVIVSLIAATSTTTGLRIKAEKSEKTYECGAKIPDEEMQRLRILKDDDHPEWNYALRPRNM
jgi:transposase